LYQACVHNADVVVGSRYVKGGETVNWSRYRNVLSKGGALYTRILTWMPVKDPTAGFICYRKEVLETINFDQINFVGYAFQIEMKFAAWKLGFKVIEIPITFVDRKFGASKMNKNIVKEGILGVLKIQWQSMFKNYRRKVRNTFIPASGLRTEALSRTSAV
ncbi:MAG TPA: polyprenol monophosphomannose synthase, partial [Agriterribacter sp.]|nr:polyprenol monophosphomannose synthase [Agriterribacter sp.]